MKNVFLMCEGNGGRFLQQKRLGRNPGFALRDRFCDSVYNSNEKKFGIRYPDGVEPSHTVVCYHKILFDADYLWRGRHPTLTKNDKLLKDYYFYICIKTTHITKCYAKAQVKCVSCNKKKNNVFMLLAHLQRRCSSSMKTLSFYYNQHIFLVLLDNIL